MENKLYNPHLRTPKTTRSIMRDVCIALLPALCGSVFFFGVRSLLVVALSVLTCVAAETLWQICHKQTVTFSDFSAIVTGLLLAFNLSSETFLWAVVVAALFSIIVVKQFFGGIGSNVLNPALMGRLLLMEVYPMELMKFNAPRGVDAVSSATVLSALKQGQESGYSLMDMFLGRVPGALGETSALLLLLGFVYLAFRKEVNLQVSASFFATIAVLALVIGQNPLMHLFAGGTILGGCFMLTDYNLSSKSGKWLYGILAGIIVMAVRRWGTYPEGVCFAILIVNCLSDLVDNIFIAKVYGKNS